MGQITLQNVGISFSEHLFKNISFSFGIGDRVGVVGNNGAGKTALLRCIAGLAEPAEGTIIRPKRSRLGYVEQVIPQALMALSLRESILDGIPLNERDYNGWRVELVLEAFGAPEDMRERPLSRLSGGWQRLALIARAWAAEPDILIIDEPTNHLDLTKIIVLENWLNREVVDIPLLIVSHDRRFLNVCTNRTLFLRPGESLMYGYSFSHARKLLEEDDRALESKKDREMKEMQRLRKSAHKLRQIGVDYYSPAALRKSIQIAKRADIIQESLPSTHIEQRRDIKLSSRSTHAKRIVVIENLTIKRPDGVPLFRVGKLEICQGDRMVVLGRNGTGKTQLVKRLRAGFANLDDARAEGIAIAPSVIMGYLDQDMSQLPDGETLRGYINGISTAGEQHTTSLLVASGFQLSQHGQKISALSPGQRARLALLSLRVVEPSFYLMDEPTNHIDIVGQEQLEVEILIHAATAILVSHDRTFVENTGTRFVVVENERALAIDSPDLYYQSLAEDISISVLSPKSQIL